MKLADVVTEDLVLLDLQATSRDNAIQELVQLLAHRGRIGSSDVEALTAAMLKREHLGSTAIGHGVAIPHAKAECADGFMAAFGRSTGGIEFSAIDGKPVHLVFLLVSPADSQSAHLKALAHISRLMTRQEMKDRILAAADEKQILEVIRDTED